MRKINNNGWALSLLVMFVWSSVPLQAQLVNPALQLVRTLRCGGPLPPEFLLGGEPKLGLSPLLPTSDAARVASSVNATPVIPPLLPGVVPTACACPPGVKPRMAPALPQQILASVHATLAAQKAIPLSSRRMFFPGKSEVDAVIFDMDGTLLDSLPAWEHSASNFVRSQGIEPDPSLDDEMAQLSLTDGARIIKERYGFNLSEEEILRLTLAPIRQHYLQDIQAKPGVLRLLKRLKAQGVKVCVATASDKALSEKVFARLGLTPYIDFVITCDEVGAGKHSPTVYDEARVRMGTAKARTLVVEDALYALQTAKKAGYLTAGVAEPFHSAAHAKIIQTEGNYFVYAFEGPNVVKNF